MFNIGGLSFHWYGILLGIGVWAGLELAMAAKPKISKEIESAFVWALIFGIVGARIYHVIDFWERYYRFNLINIFAVWEGGLGIWGAIGGAALGILIYSKVKRKNFLDLLDAFAVGAPIAQAIGRLGNRVNAEIVGKNGEPLFAYEAVLNIILFLLLWKTAREKHKSGIPLAYYLLGYGIIRILLEGMRPNEIVWRISGIPTATIFAGVAIITGILILFSQKRS